MCAISGIIGLEATHETVKKMLHTMRRRGPDANGVFQEENTTLLHTRLAVIYLQGGHQPMVLTHAGETYVMIYNG